MSGRIKGYRWFQLQIPEELHQKLKEISEESGRTMAELGEHALQRLVKNWKKHEEEKEHAKQGAKSKKSSAKDHKDPVRN